MQIEITFRKAIIIAIPAAVLLASIGFMIWDRGDVMLYQTYSIIPKQVRPGGEIQATFRVIRYRECPGVVYRTFTYENGDVHRWDPRPAALDDNMTDSGPGVSKFTYPRPRFVPITFNVPKDDPPKYRVPRGVAIYQARIDYHCNVLQDWFNWPITIRTPQIPVEIVD